MKRTTPKITRWLIVPNEMDATPDLLGPYKSGAAREEALNRMHSDDIVYMLTITNGEPEIEFGYPDGDFDEEDDDE